jgi:hypothetical protein
MNRINQRNAKLRLNITREKIAERPAGATVAHSPLNSIEIQLTIVRLMNLQPLISLFIERQPRFAYYQIKRRFFAESPG